MVTHWGMSDRLGPMSFRIGEEHVFLGKEIQEPRDFSEGTAAVIDEEVQQPAPRGRRAGLRGCRKPSDTTWTTWSKRRSSARAIAKKIQRILGQQQPPADGQPTHAVGPGSPRSTKCWWAFREP